MKPRLTLKNIILYLQSFTPQRQENNFNSRMSKCDVFDGKKTITWIAQ